MKSYTKSVSEKWKSEQMREFALEWLESLEIRLRTLLNAFFRPPNKQKRRTNDWMLEFFGMHELLRDRRHNRNSNVHTYIYSVALEHQHVEWTNERPNEQSER